MLREAKRPLAAQIQPDAFEIVTGRYTTDPYNGFSREHGGKPAVTVRIHPYVNDAVSFVDPVALRAHADELMRAAAWLAAEQILGDGAQ